MTSNPKVSVLIPTYNYVHFIDETIQSVLNQTYSDYELIIVDNKSTDDTIELVEKHLPDKRISFYQNDFNPGLTNNWNKGLDYATRILSGFCVPMMNFTPKCL